MSRLRGVVERLRALLQRSREEAEMEGELRFHLEMETEKNVREGMSPEEARRRAAIDFGGVERAKEEVRDARGVRWLEDVARDVRFALRGIRLNRLFSAALVLTLSLGIGASVVMFTVVDTLLLRPAPYTDPERLVELDFVTPEGEGRPYVDWEVAEAWRGEKGVFVDALSHGILSALFTGAGDPKILYGRAVTTNFEEVLGVRPYLGRGLFPEDASPKAAPVVLLEYAFWRSTFGGDASVVGRTMELDGERHRIVGVMPENFRFPLYGQPEFWIPVRTDGTALGTPIDAPDALARVGTEPLESVQERADATARGLAEQRPREAGWALRLSALNDGRVQNPPLRRAVWLMAGSVGLLLLMAIVNATGLLLLRGWARARETSVRVALGASRGRLVAQLLTESLVLALLSGIGATLLAALTVRAVRGALPESITFFAWFPVQLGGRALALTFAVATLAGALVALMPAIAVLRFPGARGTAGLTPYANQTARRGRLRRVLVVAQVTLSVVLLSGAGLLMNSFLRLVSVDPGFRVEDLAILRFTLSSRYDTPEARAAFMRRVEERLEALPGVEGVVMNGSMPPEGGFYYGLALQAEGAAPRLEGSPEILPMASVPPDFFEIMEVPVLAGRAFTVEDAGTDAVMIDQGLARFLWPGTSPLGRRFRVDADNDWMTVVGVVADMRMTGPDDRSGRFEVLYPASPTRMSQWAPLAIRTRGDPTPLFDEFRAVVRDLDPEQPIEVLKTARELYASTFQGQRFLMLLMAVLSGLALTLAAVGLYGVLAFDVLQRRREIGIRMALGASAGRVSGAVLAEGAVLATLGGALGVAAALGLSELVRGLLYGVEPDDPATLATVMVVSLGSALFACWWPARRAVRTDPVEVLRSE